jgi:hypothetical protein
MRTTDLARCRRQVEPSNNRLGSEGVAYLSRRRCPLRSSRHPEAGRQLPANSSNQTNVRMYSLAGAERIVGFPPISADSVPGRFVRFREAG